MVTWFCEGGTEDTNPQVTSLSNKVSAYFNDDFQNAVGNAYVLVPQCPTFWMDADGMAVNGMMTY